MRGPKDEILAVVVIAATLCATPAAAAADDAGSLERQFADSSKCGGDDYWHVHASLPAHSLGGNEGRAYRLALGTCVLRYRGMNLGLDAVASHIEVKPLGGQSGRDTPAFGVDAVASHQLHSFGTRPMHLELGGGLQYAFGNRFPADGTRMNFTVIAGLRTHVQLYDGARMLLGVRYFHVSNANLLPDNSGHDAIQLLLGVTFSRR